MTLRCNHIQVDPKIFLDVYNFEDYDLVEATVYTYMVDKYGAKVNAYDSVKDACTDLEPKLADLLSIYEDPGLNRLSVDDAMVRFNIADTYIVYEVTDKFYYNPTDSFRIPVEYTYDGPFIRDEHNNIISNEPVFVDRILYIRGTPHVYLCVVNLESHESYTVTYDEARNLPFIPAKNKTKFVNYLRQLVYYNSLTDARIDAQYF